MKTKGLDSRSHHQSGARWSKRVKRCVCVCEEGWNGIIAERGKNDKETGSLMDETRVDHPGTGPSPFEFRVQRVKREGKGR
jgi:hypothetical protein